MDHTTKINKSTIAIVVLTVVAIYAIAFGIGQHREANMAYYAKQNGCEWVYSGYIDRDPICK